MKVLNLTAHNLNDAQVKELKEKFNAEKIDNLKDIAPALFQRLVNANKDNVSELAHNLLGVVEGTDYDIIHLPISSPAVMFLFAKLLPEEIFNEKRFLFSHTERKAVTREVNGKIEKVSVFEFQGFIDINKFLKELNEELDNDSDSDYNLD